MVYCCITDDNMAPSTEYYEEIATVTQFLSEIQPRVPTLLLLSLHKYLKTEGICPYTSMHISSYHN